MRVSPNWLGRAGRWKPEPDPPTTSWPAARRRGCGRRRPASTQPGAAGIGHGDAPPGRAGRGRWPVSEHGPCHAANMDWPSALLALVTSDCGRRALSGASRSGVWRPAAGAPLPHVLGISRNPPSRMSLGSPAILPPACPWDLPQISLPHVLGISRNPSSRMSLGSPATLPPACPWDLPQPSHSAPKEMACERWHVDETGLISSSAPAPPRRHAHTHALAGVPLGGHQRGHQQINVGLAANAGRPSPERPGVRSPRAVGALSMMVRDANLLFSSLRRRTAIMHCRRLSWCLRCGFACLKR